VVAVFADDVVLCDKYASIGEKWHHGIGKQRHENNSNDVKSTSVTASFSMDMYYAMVCGGGAAWHHRQHETVA